jgi:hypothetical protein
MTSVEILIAFSVVAVTFVWLSVRKVTKEKTIANERLAFSQIVVSKLNTLYGTPAVVHGLNIVILPPALQQAVDEFLAR